MRLRSGVTLLIILLLIPTVAWAQEQEFPITELGRITDEAFSVRHEIRVQDNQTVSIVMERLSGDLIPFLAITSPDKEGVFARSDLNATGGRAELVHTFDESGEYAVNASRIEADAGLTTGDYVLTITSDEASADACPTFASPAVSIRGDGLFRGKFDDLVYRTNYLVYLEEDSQFQVVMTREDGDLRPTITLLTPDQSSLIARGVIAREDQAALEVEIETEGCYLLVAARFDLDLGGTNGRYQLTVEQTP